MAHGLNAAKGGYPSREYMSRRPGTSYEGWGRPFKKATHRAERAAASREERRALKENFD